MAQHWTPADIPDQSGRTALVTGANSGIGFETARTLAAHGARVILAGRDGARLERAIEDIRVERPDADLVPLRLDLADLASVREAAGAMAATETLDLLVNNAGVMNIPERRTTHDGLEMTVGTNHLGHFAFNALAWPAVERSASGRVVTVSAVAARWRSARFDDLMSEQRYRPMGAYAKSKRANVVYTFELARRLGDSSVVAVAVHPGAAMTSLQRHGTGLAARTVTAFAARFLMGSPSGAAWPSLYAATTPDAHSGQFLGPASRDQTSAAPKPDRAPKGADDPAEGAALWELSERLTGVRFPLRPPPPGPRTAGPTTDDTSTTPGAR